MNATGPEDRLIEIWADPRIRGFARRYAGDAHTADDALQSAYYKVARLPHLAKIENLRGYFVTVLVREIRRERDQLGALPVEDLPWVAEERQHASSLEEEVCTALDAQARYKRFKSERDRLSLNVPARSAAPSRYRAVISDAVEEILRAGVSGEASEADLPPALREAYPEYFAQPGASANTCDQRCHRARKDVRKLLIAVAWSELPGD